MTTKKLLSLLLTFLMLLSLAACGGTGQDDGKTKAPRTDDTMNQAQASDVQKQDPAKAGGSDDALSRAYFTLENPQIDETISPTYYIYDLDIPGNGNDFINLYQTPLRTDYDMENAREEFEADMTAFAQPIIDKFKTTEMFANTELNLFWTALDESDGTVDPETKSDTSAMIWGQDEDIKNEINISVYVNEPYKFISYGHVEPVNDIASVKDLDLTEVAQAIQTFAGLRVGAQDFMNAIDEIIAMHEANPESEMYMVDMQDQAAYNSIQTAVIPHDGVYTVAIACGRYVFD